MVPYDGMHPFIHKWKLFALSLLAGLLVSGFLLLALEELHEEIAKPFFIHMDLQIQQAVHGHTSVARTRWMKGLTWIGSPQLLFPGVPLIAALFWWRRLRREAMVFFISMAGGAMLNTALKLHFRRVRPDVPWALVHEHSFSFPSGHSVCAVVMYGTLVYLGMRYLRLGWERVAIIVAAVAVVSGIGLSRIYLGVHYPSDVAAGYLVGCIWLMTVIGADWNLQRMARLRRKVS